MWCWPHCFFVHARPPAAHLRVLLLGLATEVDPGLPPGRVTRPLPQTSMGSFEPSLAPTNTLRKTNLPWESLLGAPGSREHSSQVHRIHKPLHHNKVEYGGIFPAFEVQNKN